MTSNKDVTMRLPLSGVIVFSVAENCNAGCDYCYLKNSTDKAEGLLSKTDLEIIFGRYCRELKLTGIPGAGIFWHGGDALNIDPEWTAMAAQVVSDVFDGYGLEVRHAMQTNLMRYDEARRDMLKKHFNCGLGSSLDYPNLYRRFGKLSGVEYNKHWIANYRRLKNDGIAVSAISVANKATLTTKPFDFVNYYFDQVGLDGMQVNFPFGGDFWLDPKELGQWLLELLDIWYKELPFFAISPFSNLYRRIHWDRGQLFYDGMCVLDADCTRGVIGIGPDGRVSQCDTWRGNDLCDNFGNMLSADSMQDIFEHPNRRRLSERWRSLTNCLKCKWWRVCGGGCPRRAVDAFGTIEHKDYYCETYRMLFSAIASRRNPEFDKRAMASFACTAPRPQREVREDRRFL